MPPLKDPRVDKACRLKAQGLSHHQIYVACGGTGKNENLWGHYVSRWLKSPEAKARVMEYQHEISRAERNSFQVVEKDVLNGLMEIIERTTQRQAVLDPKSKKPINTVCDHCGTEHTNCKGCGEELPPAMWTFQAREATKAWELYGLHHGMFIRRSEIRTGPLDPLEGTEDEIFERTIQLIVRVGWEQRVLERLTRAAGSSAESGSAEASSLQTVS